MVCPLGRRLEGLLHAVHRIVHRPLFGALPVLEPGAAVVYGNYYRAGEVVSFHLETDRAGERFLGHAGISAVAVYLVEGGCEVDGGVVALGGADGGPDDGGGVGACREDGAWNARLRVQLVDAVEKLFCFGHRSQLYKVTPSTTREMFPETEGESGLSPESIDL